MSRIQRLILAILPRSLGEKIERESRRWMQRCPQCGAETSIWEDGGIRYSATGRPRRLRRCARCGPTWHEVYLRSEPAPNGPPAGTNRAATTKE